jgi:hypothetical protein
MFPVDGASPERDKAPSGTDASFSTNRRIHPGHQPIIALSKSARPGRQGAGGLRRALFEPDFDEPLFEPVFDPEAQTRREPQM